MAKGYQVVRMCACGNCRPASAFAKVFPLMGVCPKCGEPWRGAKATIAKKVASPFKWEEAPEAQEKMARLCPGDGKGESQ